MDNVALLPLVVIVWQAKYLTSFNSSWGLYLNFTISGNCVRKVFVLAYLHFWKKYPARADASKLPNVLCLLSQSCLCFSAMVSPEQARVHQTLPMCGEETLSEACMTEQPSTLTQSHKQKPSASSTKRREGASPIGWKQIGWWISKNNCLKLCGCQAS